MAKRIKTICFDYYMTLVKLERPFEQIKDWMSEFLGKTYPNIDHEKFFGRFMRNRAYFYSQPYFQLGIDILAKSLEKTCEYFQIPSFKDMFVSAVEEIFMSPEAYDDAHFVIEELKKSYRVGLLTNADNYILQSSISKNHFSFDFIITSNDVGCYKPDRLIFEYALSSLGESADELFMIGDSQVDDIYGAEQLGINTIWVNRNMEPLKDGLKPPKYEVTELKELLRYL